MVYGLDRLEGSKSGETWRVRREGVGGWWCGTSGEQGAFVWDDADTVCGLVSSEASVESSGQGVAGRSVECGDLARVPE